MLGNSKSPEELAQDVAADIARELREHPDHWFQGGLFRTKAGEVRRYPSTYEQICSGACWSLEGHIARRVGAYPLTDLRAMDAFRRACRITSLAKWNYAPGRTVADVISLCEAVASGHEEGRLTIAAMSVSELTARRDELQADRAEFRSGCEPVELKHAEERWNELHGAGLSEVLEALDAAVEQSVSVVDIERLRRDWVQIAGAEPVVVEYVKGTYYGFCCELAAYRIERKYNARPKCQAGYSQNRGSWYVRLETNLGAGRAGRIDKKQREEACSVAVLV